MNSKALNKLDSTHMRALAGHDAAPSVSIYLPTKGGGPEVEQNRIRFKNLIARASEHLQDWGMRRPEAERLLARVSERVEDQELQQPSSEALAVLCSPEDLWYFHLPYACEGFAVVGRRFHIKPLLPLAARGDERFYVLALAQNRVRLFAGDRTTLEQIECADLPTSMAEALRYDDDEKQLQFHTRTQKTPGGRHAVFHGHGVGKDDTKDDILRFCRRVDRAVSSALPDLRTPLLIAAVDYFVPIYRQANTHKRLLDEAIPGNPEQLSSDELHAVAWPRVEPLFSKPGVAARERYREALAKGRASNDLGEIVLAASEARVDTLWVAVDQYHWGCFDRDARHVTRHEHAGPRSEDLPNLAAIYTLRQGGVVRGQTSDQMPDGVPAAALYRF